ncbi:unnamed protein product [Darwinula stevensoni]|uniref:Uncharacterized protein n=1 Tax=Darwinula stevensoni TaxID=69355 RepID=A0A7R8X9T2_9CRUS|nr:unnamed protein product [Darwinula stevensoni]CAG0889929.1 unnamed protein product [Darwinula stevensoni]
MSGHCDWSSEVHGEKITGDHLLALDNNEILTRSFFLLSELPGAKEVSHPPDLHFYQEFHGETDHATALKQLHFIMKSTFVNIQLFIDLLAEKDLISLPNEIDLRGKTTYEETINGAFHLLRQEHPERTYHLVLDILKLMRRDDIINNLQKKLQGTSEQYVEGDQGSSPLQQCMNDPRDVLRNVLLLIRQIILSRIIIVNFAMVLFIFKRQMRLRAGQHHF